MQVPQDMPNKTAMTRNFLCQDFYQSKKFVYTTKWKFQKNDCIYLFVGMNQALRCIATPTLNNVFEVLFASFSSGWAISRVNC